VNSAVTGKACLVVLLAVGALLGLRADPGLPSAEALHRFLSQELPDLPPPSADSMSTQEYLRTLEPRVIPEEPAATDRTWIARARTYPLEIGYLRVARVEEGLTDQLADALAGLQKTQTVHGVVMDLRFAGGTAYPEAERAAERLKALLSDAGSGAGPGGAAGAGEPPAGRDRPLVVLINQSTREAAEAFVLALRSRVGRSLTIGTNTAGRLWQYRTVQLPGGDRVRVAGDPVALPSQQKVGREGVVPDIRVAVPPADEALYWEDEFRRVLDGKPVPPDATSRMNEAELVLRRRLRVDHPFISTDGPRGGRGGRPGGDRDGEERPRPVKDPVLARGLDILDGVRDLSQRPAGGESR